MTPLINDRSPPRSWGWDIELPAGLLQLSDQCWSNIPDDASQMMETALLLARSVLTKVLTWKYHCKLCSGRQALHSSPHLELQLPPSLTPLPLGRSASEATR